LVPASLSSALLPYTTLFRSGGGQERGLRSGTLPTPLVVGLGEAAAIAAREMASETERLLALRRRLHEGLVARLDGVALNGDPERSEEHTSELQSRENLVCRL